MSADSPSPARILIRRLAAEDAPAFHALRLAALEECPAAFGASPEDERHLSPAQVAARIAPPDPGQGASVGAFSGPALVGMACVYREAGRKNCHKAHLVSVYMDPAHRGAGISSRLVRDAIGLARTLAGVRRMNLTVAVDNTAALALYRRLGFEVYGREPESLYVNGVYHDAFLMTLSLEQAA